MALKYYLLNVDQGQPGFERAGGFGPAKSGSVGLENPKTQKTLGFPGHGHLVVSYDEHTPGHENGA